MRNKLPAGLGVDGDEKLDLSLMPDEVEHWLLLLIINCHTLNLSIEYQCYFGQQHKMVGRQVFVVYRAEHSSLAQIT